MKRGWTLVEILVVMAVVGAMTAIVLPVMGGLKDRADQAACLNNLRELGVAMESYLIDNAQIFPEMQMGREGKGSPDVMQEILLPYVGNPEVFRCPADQEHFEDTGSSYFWNHHASGIKKSRVAMFGMDADQLQIPLIHDKEAFHGDENGTNFLFIDLSAGRNLDFDVDTE